MKNQNNELPVLTMPVLTDKTKNLIKDSKIVETQDLKYRIRYNASIEMLDMTKVAKFRFSEPKLKRNF